MAKIQLKSIFQDNMILQRGKSIPINGKTVPGARVECSFGPLQSQTSASQQGEFTLLLPPMEAAGGKELIFRCGDETLTLHNVAVGDLYLAAGQSNMEFQLQNATPGWDSLAESDFSGIRYFHVPVTTDYGEKEECGGKWRELTKENAKECSACAFFFGRAVRRGTGVPIGLIEASRGGINIESWVSRETLLAHPEYKAELLAYEKKVAEATALPDGPVKNADIEKGIMEFFPQEPDDTAQAAGFALPDFDDSAWETLFLPESWTQAGYNHAGVFWFRRSVEIPASAAGKDLEIHLGAVDKADQVYFNGMLIGRTGDSRHFEQWSTLRVYPVPAALVRPERNVIAVRAASCASICTDGGLLGPEKEMYLAIPGADSLPLSGKWRLKETVDAGTIGMTFMRQMLHYDGALHMLYDNMIFPLRRFPLRGILWYQGEANSICMAHTYRALLSSLIREYRENTGDPETDFFIVQLPDYGPVHYFAPFSQWSRIREAQTLAAQENNAECIVTLGYGDVTNLHPLNKLAVGEAAAKIACAKIAGKAVPHPPVLSSWGHGREGKTLLLNFFDTGSALPPAGTLLHGFTIAGDEGVAHVARAVVLNETTVELSSSAVPAPTAFWYAWADNPEQADFRGADGMPVAPFRASEKEISVRNLIHREAEEA